MKKFEGPPTGGATEPKEQQERERIGLEKLYQILRRYHGMVQGHKQRDVITLSALYESAAAAEMVERELMSLGCEVARHERNIRVSTLAQEEEVENLAQTQGVFANMLELEIEEQFDDRLDEVAHLLLDELQDRETMPPPNKKGAVPSTLDPGSMEFDGDDQYYAKLIDEAGEMLAKRPDLMEKFIEKTDGITKLCQQADRPALAAYIFKKLQILLTLREAQHESDHTWEA